MTRVVLVVFDGLRPDMIRLDTAPNLLRFAAMGTVMPRARSVFPSETRVCTASVATGCHPRRHGIMANRMLHPTDPARMLETGKADALRAFEQESGQNSVLMPGLSDILAASGQDFAVFSSGTTGQTFILAPRADRLGQVVVSAHGAQACSAAGQAVFARLPPPPAAPAARAVWIADAWRTTQLPDPPSASVVWLCEPDTSGHYDGLGSPGQHAALQAADAAFGRLLDDWQAGPHRDTLQVIVASDHGHVAIDRQIDLAGAFADAAVLEGCRFTGGASGGIAVADGDRKRIAEIAAWLMRQDWIGQVFAADIAELPAGALPHSAALVDHRRAGHLLYTLANTAGAGPTGLPGTTLSDRATPLAVGAGTHGGLNRREMSTVLMLAGSRIRSGQTSTWPAGLVDIAPTILSLLGIPGAAAMDGRVLGEALADGAAPAESHSPETWEASGMAYAQRVARLRVGRHVWIDHGERL